VIDPADRADTGAFLVRLLRLDPTAVVRSRPIPPSRSVLGPRSSDLDPPRRRQPAAGELWAMLPFRVLVMRPLTAAPAGDITVAASQLLADLEKTPPRRDSAWRWPVPSSRGRPVERIPAHEIARVAAAASRTLRAAMLSRAAGELAVGERMVRDTLLDHVPIVVTGPQGERVEVPQRMVQAVVRMGFLGRVTNTHGDDVDTQIDAAVTERDASTTITSGDNLVTVRLTMGWIGLDASYGSTWYRPISPLRLG
jgi:hypothetical protein